MKTMQGPKGFWFVVPPSGGPASARTLPPSRLKAEQHAGPARRGFTLIELILVMGILAAVLAVAAPSLSSFFRGRDLDSEGRRFLALTRLGQSRAVSEGIPMLMWMDPRQGAYGLLADPTFDPPGFNPRTRDTNRVSFVLDDDITMAVSAPLLLLGGGASVPLLSGHEPFYIRFTPDGYIDESSPYQVVLTEGEQSMLEITQSGTGRHYEIQDPNKLLHK